MEENISNVLDLKLRGSALSQWDGDTPVVGQPSGQAVVEGELHALRIRVAALENLVIGLLSAATDHERSRAREIALRRSRKPACSYGPAPSPAGG